MIDFPFFFKPIPTQKAYSAATKTSIFLATDMPLHHQKRQVEPSQSVVHVTVTAAGTVVYTYTATSYSYIPSYSPVSPPNNTGNSGTNSSGVTNNTGETSGPNLGATIGGAVGGVAFIALIGLAFFLLRRSKNKRKRQLQKSELIEDDDSYYQGHHRHTSLPTAIDTVAMNTPAPRHLVAPLNHLGEREGDGRESKYYQHDGGYYEDIVVPFNQKGYYSANNSTTSDSLPSTAVDTNGVFARQVPNEVDYPVVYSTTNAEERYIPHLKDDTAMVEPPHTRG